jgi:hypothetical protein
MELADFFVMRREGFPRAAFGEGFESWVRLHGIAVQFEFVAIVAGKTVRRGPG